MPIVVKLSIELSVTSNSFSPFSRRLLYISLSPPEVVLAISYKVMLIKDSLLDQFCEPAISQRTISCKSHERRRYYVEILYYTSVSRLCPRRGFVS